MNQKIKVFVPFSSRAYGYVHYVHFYKEQVPQADVSRLVSRLRVKINDKQRKLSRPTGPEGRLLVLRQTVTALLKYERLELNYVRAHESQGYAERLISEAIRHGDCHIATMEMADYWLLEKQLIHKLFKVLVPRFEHFNTSYTRLFNSPRPYFGDGFYEIPKDNYIDVKFAKRVARPKGVIELKGNPYPPIISPQVSNPRLLHNALLRAASEEKRKLQVQESLKAQGFLGKSERIESILRKSITAQQSETFLGSDQTNISEAPAELSEPETDVKSAVREEVETSKECSDSTGKADQSDKELNKLSSNDSCGTTAVKDESITEPVTERTKPN